jgi:hypothetical protein
MVRLEEAGSLPGSVGRLLRGIGICFAMGVLGASVLAIGLYMIAGTTLIGWWGWFLAYLIVLASLLIWHERKTRPDYVSDSVRATEPKSSSRREAAPDQTTPKAPVYIAWAVWGPLALLEGMRGMRGMRTRAQHAVLDRAGLLIVDLSQSMQGIEIRDLMHPPEDMDVFSASVDLLDKHGWIGKATDGQSMWLNSTFRQKLLALRKPS